MVTLAMEGISQFRRYLELFLPKMVSMAIVLSGRCYLRVFQDKTSALILILALPILIVFMILLGLVAQKKPIANGSPIRRFPIISWIRSADWRHCGF